MQFQKKRFSLKEILSHNREEVSQSIFTSLEEVVECSTMDQVSVIIEKLTSN